MDMPSSSIIDLIRRLSGSELSVLRAILETPGSQVATVKGSANDMLWSTLAAQGLARESPLALDVPLPPNLRPKSFTLTEEGREAVPRLVAEAFKG